MHACFGIRGKSSAALGAVVVAFVALLGVSGAAAQPTEWRVHVDAGWSRYAVEPSFFRWPPALQARPESFMRDDAFTLTLGFRLPGVLGPPWLETWTEANYVRFPLDEEAIVSALNACPPEVECSFRVEESRPYRSVGIGAGVGVHPLRAVALSPYAGGLLGLTTRTGFEAGQAIGTIDGERRQYDVSRARQEQAIFLGLQVAAEAGLRIRLPEDAQIHAAIRHTFTKISADRPTTFWTFKFGVAQRFAGK